jgi:hypothetical protein
MQRHLLRAVLLQITLQYVAFQQKLANPNQGAVGIRWRPVECEAPGGIVVDIDTYRASGVRDRRCWVSANESLAARSSAGLCVLGDR